MVAAGCCGAGGTWAAPRVETSACRSRQVARRFYRSGLAEAKEPHVKEAADSTGEGRSRRKRHGTAEHANPSVWPPDASAFGSRRKPRGQRLRVALRSGSGFRLVPIPQGGPPQEPTANSRRCARRTLVTGKPVVESPRNRSWVLRRLVGVSAAGRCQRHGWRSPSPNGWPAVFSRSAAERSFRVSAISRSYSSGVFETSRHR